MAQEKGKVGSLFFGMTLDTNDFKKKLKDAKKDLAKTGKELRESFASIAKGGLILGSAFAAAGAGLFLFAKGSAEATNEQLLLADSIGATQSEIAGLEVASQKLGVEQGMLIDKMREAGGIDEFKQIADQVKNAGDESAQLAKAQELLGNEGLKLLPILQQGAAGLNAMEQEAINLGLALSPQQINESRVAWKAYEDTLLQLKGVGKQIGAALMEPFGLASAGLGSFIKTFKDDIINGFKFVAEVITGFIRDSFNLFAKFGIPMINGILQFASSLGDTFSDIFSFLSSEGESTFTSIGDFFLGFVEFLATFKQTFIASVSGAISTVLKFAFNSLAKLSEFLGDQLTTIAFLGEELGLVDEGFGQAVSDSFTEQSENLRRMGKDLAKPFGDAQDAAIDEAAKILEDLAKKNETDQNTFLSGIAAFSLKFGDTIGEAGKTAAKVAQEIKAERSEKRTGIIVSGSQEEARLLNAQNDKNLQIQQQQLNEAKKLNRNFGMIGIA